MRTKQLLIFLLTLLIIMPLVSSVPPFQQDSADTGFEIAGIDFSSIKMNMNRTAVACVFNDTNGVPISSGISCQFRIYEVSLTGSLKFTNTTPTINGNCFNFGIPNNVYTTAGEYTRIIMCNNSVAGGFYKSTFEATPNGNISTIADAINTSWQIIILIIALIVFMVMGMIFKIDSVKIFFFVMAGLTLFMLVGLGLSMAQNYLYDYLQYITIYSAYYTIFAIVGGTAIIGLVIWFIYYTFQKFSKTKIGDFDED